jgi:hypothetical protein
MAAEAAGAQGRFWDMHDTLYANQQQLDSPALLAYASALGLDVNRLGNEVAGHVHLPKISEDFISRVRSGVNGTPAFFFNGVRHDGSWDYPPLAIAVQQAAVAAVRSGVLKGGRAQPLVSWSDQRRLLRGGSMRSDSDVKRDVEAELRV